MEINRDLYNRDYHQGILNKFIKLTVYQKDKIRNLLELVSPQPNDRILEVGCSSGGSVFLFAQHNATVMGMDFDDQAIKVANEHKSTSPKYGLRCNFLKAKAEEVIGEFSPNKVTMIDFTEHVPDNILLGILKELKENSNENWVLYVYTPDREHWIEFLKKRNIILKEEITHTNLRNMDETVQLLQSAGYTIEDKYFRPFHLPFFKLFEYPLSCIPYLGRIFKRRICITAVPN